MLKRLIKGSAIVLIVILCLGVFYEMAASTIDSFRYPAPGVFAKVGKEKIHISGSGTGSVTVVLLPGLGTPSPYADFSPIYDKIARLSRVVVYERPGYGWSSAARTPRLVDNVVDEMRDALWQAGERPPFIFVAHSLASVEAIRYAQRFADDVRGIITIDGGNPDYYAAQTPADTSGIGRLLDAAKMLGVARLGMQLTDFYGKLAAQGRNTSAVLDGDRLSLDKAMLLKRFSNASMREEGFLLPQNAKTVVQGGTIGDIPLTVLTASDEIQQVPGWKESQEQLLKWSTNSRQQVVDGAGHYIHLFKPEAVNQAITDMLTQVRLKSVNGGNGGH